MGSFRRGMAAASAVGVLMVSLPPGRMLRPLFLIRLVRNAEPTSHAAAEERFHLRY
jgi:hypothetical protein